MTSAPRRGDLWTVAGGGYASKPRPALVVQDDRFDGGDSLVVALVTSDPTDSPLLRIVVESVAGLDRPSRIMVDKIMTVRRSALGAFIGRVGPDTMLAYERALLVFLGIAS